MLAMVVNDDAYKPDKRGALESIAEKPAPTVLRYRCFPVNDEKKWPLAITFSIRRCLSLSPSH
ncbi:hypothetical protein EI969_10560 [Pseudomonas sp. PB101]|nr:hypothetical protein [Pseudomonas sp. PB101]